MYQKVVNPINLEYDVCQQLLLYLFIKTFSLKIRTGMVELFVQMYLLSILSSLSIILLLLASDLHVSKTIIEKYTNTLI